MKWILALAPLAVGCGSYNIPTSHVQAAPASISSAEQAGAGSTPGASERLVLAEARARDRQLTWPNTETSVART